MSAHLGKQAILHTYFFLILTKFFFLHFAFCLEDLSGSFTIDEEMEKDIKSRVVILLRPHHIWAHRIISILIQTGTKTIPLHQKCNSNHKSWHSVKVIVKILLCTRRHVALPSLLLVSSHLVLQACHEERWAECGGGSMSPQLIRESVQYNLHRRR